MPQSKTIVETYGLEIDTLVPIANESLVGAKRNLST